MHKYIYVAIISLSLVSFVVSGQEPRIMLEVTPEGKGKVNTKVDNMGYWSRMARMGYVRTNPAREIPAAAFNGTKILPYPGSDTEGSGLQDWGFGIPPQDSPDVPVTGKTDVTQSENSIFIDPEDENTVLNSNNSSNWISGYALNKYGADALYSFDNGQEWAGSTGGVNGSNAGDPATAIGLNGWWYVGRISGDYGQAVSYSKDKGKTWKRVTVGAGPSTGIGLLDKNHLWIDNSPTSPFKGYLYDAWTNFIPGDPDTNQVEIVRSTDQGLTWSAPYNISAAAAALKLNHGVNLQTGPNGEVYAAWSIYDTWPSDETAIGFAKSVDGGGIFTPATRIISNIKGIRASLTSKNMRVNAFPSMAVDNSTGPNRGTIYLVWPNVGYPGINTGTDIDVFMIRSHDGGSTWSAPIRVNQDPPGLGKQHFFPWITCDPVTGGLCTVYYDDRNTDTLQAQVYVSWSYDGGNTWNDMQVSDYTFTPDPIPGMAFSYFGDYIGIQSKNMKVYPIWTGNHDAGRAMTYVSPFDLGPNPGQPWVIYYSDSLATVSGTGNVTLNYGDSVYLTVGIKNIGDQPATEVLAHISTTSPYITLTDSVAGYGTIGAGQLGIALNGFTLKVSDTIPDNLMVRFNLKVIDIDSSWFSHFSMEAHAPDLKINVLTIFDTIHGNHNGRMDPGETVNLVIPTANSGDFPCPQTFGLLSTTSPYFTLINDSVFLGDIPARSSKSAVFTVVVDSLTPVGTGSDLIYMAFSGLLETSRMFRLMTGQVMEDWESNSFVHLPWQSAGSKPWTISGIDPWEGSYAAVSGSISDYQSSQLILNYATATYDSIVFYLRTSSEQDYDFLTFSVDGVTQDRWSGETPWRRAAFPVAAGEHTFKWIYQKDLAYASGQDRVWIDYIGLPPPVLPAVDPGAGDTICAGMHVILQATAQHYDSVKWTTPGDGVFGNDTALITQYIPGDEDLISGNAILMLTGYGRYGSAAGTKHVRIHPLPVASITAIPGDTVCSGQNILLVANTAGVTSWHWAPGNFTTPEVFYDTAITGGTGHRMITLSTTNVHQCHNSDSLYLMFSDCSAIKELLVGYFNIYPNPGSGIFMLETGTPEPEPFYLSVKNALNVTVFRHVDKAPRNKHALQLDLSFLPDGLYLMLVTTTRGTTTHKLVIRK